MLSSSQHQHDLNHIAIGDGFIQFLGIGAFLVDINIDVGEQLTVLVEERPLYLRIELGQVVQTFADSLAIDLADLFVVGQVE